MDNSSASAMDIYRGMSSVDRYSVLANIWDQCIREVELWFLLRRKTTPVCYVWFEPSPKMSIAEGLMKTMYINKMVRAGCAVKIMMADLFALCYKTGSYNLDQLRTIGCYNIEMWRAAGMYLERVELVWLSDELNHHPSDYWPVALDISTKSTVDQMARCCGDIESFGAEMLPGAELFYPCLQVAVILCQKADMWLLSIDQQNVGVTARNYSDHLKRKNKPIILLHNILPSLLKDPEFQEVADQGHTIFMEDDAAVLHHKMRRVFCPPNLALGNPCLEYIKHVIFPWFGKLEVVHNEEHGNRTYASMEELIDGYESGAVDSASLKLAFERALNKMLQPVHDHFRDNSRAMSLFLSLKKYKRDRQL